MMYYGKYKNSVKSVRRKKPAILLISIVLLLCAVIGGTIALLMDTTNEVVNTFTPAEVEVNIEENFADNVKEDVYIYNSGDVPVYIRVRLVENWKIDGQIVPKPVDPAIVWGAEGWFEVNGIYYYEDPVASSDKTTNLIDQVTVTLPDNYNYSYHLDILAEAIQADPADAVKDAWKDVDVVDGRLTAANQAG